jgi:hypothetical protein
MKAFRRWLSVAVVSVVVVLMALSPAAASLWDPSPADTMRLAGCSAKLVMSSQHSVAESAFSWMNNTLYLGTAPGHPKWVYQQVLRHEIGHCIQLQNKWIFNAARYDYDVQKVELEADQLGAGLACKDGLDGGRLNEALWHYVHDTYGYDGDFMHGTLDQRIAAGYSSPDCPRGLTYSH